MISCACGRRSIGYTRAHRSSSSHQPPTICGDSDDVAQVSITSVSPMKPPGRPRSVSAYPGAVSLCGSIGSSILGRQDRRVEARLAGGVERVPDRERHAEEPLPADQPVGVQTGDPVLVPLPHRRRLPSQLAAGREQRVPVRHRADEPLAAGHDLQRAVAVLVELHRVRDRSRRAEQLAGRRSAARRSRAGPAARCVRPARRSSPARLTPSRGRRRSGGRRAR